MAENKEIANLNFNIKDALNDLDKVDKKLKEIAESSERYTKRISSGINGAFQGSSIVNSGEVQKELQTITGYVNNFGNKMKYTLSGKIDFSKLINADAIKKDLGKVESIGEKNAQKLVADIMKQELSLTAKRKKNASDLQLYKSKKNIEMLQQEGKKNDKILEYDAYKNMKLELQNNQHQNKMEEISSRQLNSTKTLYDKIAEYGKTYLIYQGFNELRKATKETIDEMVNMEYQMIQIDRVFNEGSLNIDNYRDKLIQLAYDYGNSFENVADVTLRLAQAGFDSEEALKLTEKTLLALNTAELDATDATSGMVAIMAQWGLMTGDAAQEAKDYGEIIDKINKVADNFPTTSKDILDALKKTSSAFNIAGASIDETIATIVAAEKASQRGGKVIGTALGNIVQQLKAEKKLDLAEELGLNFFKDADKTEFKPIMEIFQEMSERMETLKKEGKESSTEMQGLLEMFTVFRRNIGASLLGEMSGEDSTYAEVLKTSIDSVGYSLQENAKHMETAKAAQAQFNAELLKLKTQVWDQGLEDVFRDMLKAGIDLTHGISQVLDKFGVFPVSIGAVVLAFTLLNKNTRATNWIGLTKDIKAFNSALNRSEVELKNTSKSFKKYTDEIKKDGKASMMGYTGYLTKAGIKTIWLTAKTIALQAAISAGLSLAITALVAVVDNWIHADEKAIEKNRELKETSEENAARFEEERKSIESLRKEYEILARKEKRTPEEEKRIYEIQEKINGLIRDSGEQVELVTRKINDQGKEVQVINDKYDQQIAKIKAVEYEKKKEEAEDLKSAAEAAEKLKTPMKASTFFDFFGGIESQIKNFGGGLEKFYKEINSMQGFPDSKEKYGLSWIEKLDFDTQIKLLSKWERELKRSERKGKDVSKALDWVSSSLGNLEGKQKSANDATQKYTDALSELYGMTGYADRLSASLQKVFESYNIEGPRKLIEQIQDINTKFSNGKMDVEEYFNAIQEKIGQIDLSKEGEELEAYRAIFAETTRSLAEGIDELQAKFDSNDINFADYSNGMKEASENALDLFAKQNNLVEENGRLTGGATEEINNYANTLRDAGNELSLYGDILKTIDENYKFISEHANEAGEAMFKAGDESNEMFQNLATTLTNNLNSLRDSNQEVFESMTKSIADNIGISTNEMLNADGYLNQGFLNQFKNMNGALNAISKATAKATQKLTTSMGTVLSKLGDAISKFDYTVSGSLAGFQTKEIDVLGKKFKIPVGLKFKVTGEGGDSIQNLSSALQNFGSDVTDLGNLNYGYFQLKQQAPYQPYTPSGPSNAPRDPYRPNSPGGGGSRSNRDYAAEQAKRDAREAERAAREAEKAAEDEYKRKLKLFKDYLAEKERLEKRWVDKQKELGLLSNQDFLFITKERIERHKKYLDEIKKQTWLKAEDRLKLEKEYSEKIEDLQLDYMGYLKDKLEDDIEALEKANDEKIDLIEKEADKRIEALRKVEKENDRIRAKEDYEKKRQEHLNDVNYWSERTGREATEALAEAKKNLKDLDEEWKKQQEDWSNEDQIQKIEEERDAQIKAIQDAQQKQIDAWRAAYEEKVRLFGETGQIIYENTVIQSEALYNIYKSKFIDPIAQELANLNSAINTPPPTPAPAPAPTPAPEPEKRYETYKIVYGDTLSGIAQRFGTTVEKIMAANPYIKNKNRIYAGKTLQIPKFHNGGIVGGTEEGFALLKPNEVVLKPEWADGINKLAKMAKNKENPITNSTVIEVKGDLVKIDANLKNKGDVDYLGRRIEKVLKDKFNIKK